MFFFTLLTKRMCNIPSTTSSRESKNIWRIFVGFSSISKGSESCSWRLEQIIKRRCFSMQLAIYEMRFFFSPVENLNKLFTQEKRKAEFLFNDLIWLFPRLFSSSTMNSGWRTLLLWIVIVSRRKKKLFSNYFFCCYFFDDESCSLVQSVNGRRIWNIDQQGMFIRHLNSGRQLERTSNS